MPRSQITESWKKAEAMVFHVQENLNADEYAVFLDMIDPLPEPEAKPTKKARKKSASKKSSRASSLEQQIQKRSRRELTTDETFDDLTGGFEPCTVCEAAPDANIHHLQTVVGYHPFLPAVSPASDLSSANGGAGSSPASSATQKASAGNVLPEAKNSENANARG